MTEIDCTTLANAAEIIAQHFANTTSVELRRLTPSFEALMTDEYQWGDGESPIIMWEEGPYNWVNELPDQLHNFLHAHHLFAEPVTSWALGIYPV